MEEEEEDEDIGTLLEKKFEANNEIKKVEKAKTTDGQENEIVAIETDLVSSIKFNINHYNL